jgi:LmbE family N-acetylglucosaminyl deacetylase
MRRSVSFGYLLGDYVCVIEERIMRNTLVVLWLSMFAANICSAQQTRLEHLQSKTILVFTPHPDDDVFGAGGTIALLNRNHNRVYIVVYTNDDKGSYDLGMTSQRLAQIRKAEQEASEGLLGTPKENISWMGYDDGMLEYAPQPKLTEEATAIIRRVRPDVLLSVDPGEWFERWHKTDHRMAAFNTIDAVRAAEFWLYFPNQKLQQGLEPYKVPEMYFFYPSPQEANYLVNIDEVAELKFDAAAKQVSQFEPAVKQYRADWTAEDLKKAKDEMRREQPKKDGHYVEAFRYATAFNQF